MPKVPSIFVFYRDTEQRRRILAGGESCAAERYCLYGLEQSFHSGLTVGHSLDDGVRPSWLQKRLSAVCNRLLRLVGGYGGDFATVWRCRHRANAADLIVATADTVGFAVVLLRRLGILRRPVVYISMGLPERLQHLRGATVRRFYQRAFGRVEAFVAYGGSEIEEIRQWLGNAASPDLRFIPFGADVEWFRPATPPAPDVEIVSVGGDPHRDFPLLVDVLRRRADWRALIVTDHAHAARLRALPPNASMETDVPFARVREFLNRGRVVVLPVRDNSYSGATTVLLQAMAMAKPVVVTRTRAIQDGYHLEDGVNCRLIPPGDAAALGQAIQEVLADPGRAQTMGAAARATVVTHHAWDQYLTALRQLILQRAGVH